MNLAQAVVYLGHGCYAWRGDISPGPETFAHELWRCIQNVVRAPALPAERPQHHGCDRTWAPSAHHAQFIEALLAVLRRAGRNRVKLSAEQLRELLDVTPDRYRTMRRILNWLHAEGRVCRDGRYGGAVYWAEP